MSRHSRDDKRQKRVRQRRNAEKTQAHKLKLLLWHNRSAAPRPTNSRQQVAAVGPIPAAIPNKGDLPCEG
jgi:hypothetical protein